jgi:hypothetical protein
MSVSEVKTLLERDHGLRVNPRAISTIYYEGLLDAPVVAGRRQIAADQIPALLQILRRRGRLTVARG